MEVAEAEADAEVAEPLAAPAVVEAAALLLEAAEEVVDEAALLEELLRALEALAEPQVTDWQAVMPSKSLGWALVQSARHCSQMREGRVCW